MLNTSKTEVIEYNLQQSIKNGKGKPATTTIYGSPKEKYIISERMLNITGHCLCHTEEMVQNVSQTNSLTQRKKKKRSSTVYVYRGANTSY